VKARIRFHRTKLRKVKIVVQPIKDAKTEWKKALRGEVRSIQPEGTIIFTSLAAVARALSPARLELLGSILKHKPESIYALAKVTERDCKNVYADVKLLTEIGLVELKPTGKRHSVRPVAKYSGFEVDLAA
jgi:predicted transcriptional regulator